MVSKVGNCDDSKSIRRISKLVKEYIETEFPMFDLKIIKSLSKEIANEMICNDIEFQFIDIQDMYESNL